MWVQTSWLQVLAAAAALRGQYGGMTGQGGALQIKDLRYPRRCSKAFFVYVNGLTKGTRDTI